MNPRSILAILLAAALAACAAAGPGAGAAAAGSYALAAVDGQPLPEPSPAEPDVTIESGALELGPDGRYTLDLVGRAGNGTPDARRVFGSYRLRGGRLVLTPAETLADPVRYTVRRGPGVLHLADERGAELTFVRR